MKLAKYLEQTGQKADDFARTVKVSKSALYRYLADQAIPPKSVMARIALATGCHVTANDFYDLVSAEEAGK